MTLKIVSYDQNPSEFLKILSNCTMTQLPNPVQFELESCYRKAEHGEGFKDLSHFTFLNEKPESCALYHKYTDKAGGFNGSGAEIHGNLDAAIDGLCELARACGLPSVKVAIRDENKFFNYATAREKFRAELDLTQTEELIHAGVRKSFKSLINNGRSLIKFQAITKNNPDETAFRAFEDFHLRVAGKKTRSSESWDIQFKMIKAGEAELLMGHMTPYGLVSSALFTDYGPTTSYAVAVYDRDLFDKPLAHANVYEGLLRAKKRGKTIFNLGVMPQEGEATEKEINIGKFKKGFVSALTKFTEWNIPLSEPKRKTNDAF